MPTLIIGTTTKRLGDKTMIRKERKVGEIFEFEGVKLQVVDIGEYGNGCKGCYFQYNCSGYVSAFIQAQSDRGNNICLYHKVARQRHKS